MSSAMNIQWIEKNISKIFLSIIFLRIIFALGIGYVDDDAYHWTWTRNLDWSYFDHPGMIAWLEWISMGLFGDNRFGICLSSFLCFISVVYLMYQFSCEFFD
jgi:dolichol-phosphate mannosyltransferase